MRHILQAATASLLLAISASASAASVFNYTKYSLTRVSPGSYEESVVSHELLDTLLARSEYLPGADYAQSAKTGTDVVKASARLNLSAFAADPLTNIAIQSVSAYSTRVAPTATSSFTVNGFFNAATSMLDGKQLDDRKAVFDLGSSQWDGIAVGASQTVFSIMSQVNFTFGLFDLFTGEFQTFDVTQRAARTLDIFNDNGTLKLVTVPGSGAGYFSDVRKSYCSGIDYNCATVSYDFEAYGSGTSDYNLSFDASVIAGREYILTLSMSCMTSAFTAQGSIGDFQAYCDADHSGYWNGLTNISAPNFALIGETGQNYVFSSPNSPQPLVSNVPEPTQWALLIAGFGLAGFAVRRRRPVPA